MPAQSPVPKCPRATNAEDTTVASASSSRATSTGVASSANGHCSSKPSWPSTSAPRQRSSRSGEPHQAAPRSKTGRPTHPDGQHQPSVRAARRCQESRGYSWPKVTDADVKLMDQTGQLEPTRSMAEVGSSSIGLMQATSRSRRARAPDSPRCPRRCAADDAALSPCAAPAIAAPTP